MNQNSEKNMLNVLVRVTKTATNNISIQCIFAKLSFVKITPFCMYHKKTLIFSGIFAFQKAFFSLKLFVATTS